MKNRLIKLLLALATLPVLETTFLKLVNKLAGPYKTRRKLINLSGKSYVSPWADIQCPQFQVGQRAFIDPFLKSPSSGAAPDRLTCNPTRAITELNMPQSDLLTAASQQVAWYRIK